MRLGEFPPLRKVSALTSSKHSCCYLSLLLRRRSFACPSEAGSKLRNFSLRNLFALLRRQRFHRLFILIFVAILFGRESTELTDSGKFDYTPPKVSPRQAIG